ncbi:MAG TPA: DUF1028 domain-containing protein [Candidatus Polarisedimenticolaceae bacterium]|nr:DUF1028 domain-containing protein [Candidatus Polarisedimenticolaceae bacterium]
MRMTITIAAAISWAVASTAGAAPPRPATFSIAAADPEAGEVGVAVASRFFAVGSVVPFAKAGVGAVATQSFANTTYGPRGLDLLERGVSPEEVVRVLTRADDGRDQRQIGVVAANGDAATYSGPKCNPWAGGRRGPGYAVQGNILTGEDVVAAMERAFLESKGKPLAERLYAAIVAGDAKGGDSRGRQSMALLVAREKGGYGGFTDRAVDLRVDDHADPIVEMGRLLAIGLVNDYWNRGWTAFTEKRFADALPWQERAAAMAEKQPAILPEVLYDLAVIRLAAGNVEPAKAVLARALTLNPKLKQQAERDPDLAKLRP